MISDNNISRRTVLRESGFIAGSSLVGLSTSIEIVEGNASKKFVELKIEHTDLPEFPPSHTDNFSPYRYNPVTNTLDISAIAKQAVKDMVRNNDEFMSVNKIRMNAVPNNAIDPTPPTLLSSRPGFRLMLAEEYSPPKPHVEFNNSTAIISVNGEQESVSPGSQQSMKLSQQTVMGRIYGGDGSVKSRKVTPVIRIKNRGDVNVSIHSKGGEK